MKILKKIIVIVLVLVLLAALGYGVYKLIPKESANNKTVSEIKNYNYTLYDNKGSGYKNLFKELVKELDKEVVNEENYATLISKMFIIDFYTLTNKKTKNDVGGVQFVYKTSQENFALEASDTVYKYLENNLNNDRTQKLPEVSEVVIAEKSIINMPYTYGDKTDDKAYQVDATINYKEDLGYPKKIELILIHSEIKKEEITLQKLEIVSVNEGEIE